MPQDGPNPQKEAEALIEHIHSVKDAKLDQDIESCLRGNPCLIYKQAKYRGFSANGPVTPPRVELARKIDAIITQRRADESRQALDSQNLAKLIARNMVPIDNFLRAARRADHQDVNFPILAIQLLNHLHILHNALTKVEEMVSGNEDADFTEPDTEYNDEDRTRVERLRICLAVTNGCHFQTPVIGPRGKG
ncbi:hypothetical protein C8R43DRAFT_1155638 [Mycena crocata]|nr:hypothetical protein C8R43DRAFT_1155638 [Mycena crocata]